MNSLYLLALIHFLSEDVPVTFKNGGPLRDAIGGARGDLAS